MKTLILALALTVSGSAFAAETKKDCSADSNYPEVSKQELTDMVAKKEAFVIDVNSKESYAKSHVPTAIHFGTEEGHLAGPSGLGSQGADSEKDTSAGSGGGGRGVRLRGHRGVR